MTWGEYVAYDAGLTRRRTERWEQTRKIAYMIGATMGGVKETEAKFMPLPFDTEYEPDEESYFSDEMLNNLID